MSDHVVTRIAPSPTGFMHVGTARTALFNWLYARGRGGRFVLRIEDTDRERSTDAATKAILDGMAWLGLDYDGEAVSQFERAPRHAEVAHDMLARGQAYKCFSTQDDIQAFRDAARAEGRSTLFQSPWRDAPAETHPDAPYVIRIKAPKEGETIIEDEVQGRVVIQNAQLDDMVCLRSDGTPTYMLAVVVDDHDMGVTHVIRGDDHLNNAARQMLVYRAMDWPVPVWAHIPLIHGPDGKKLSKRHGALGVGEYRGMGYIPEGMRNYLARLGWSHGDDELFTTEQATAWFDLKGIGKSPSRFDFKKLDHVNGHHISASDDQALVDLISDYCASAERPAPSEEVKTALTNAMYCLKDRAKTLPDLLEKAHFLLTERPLNMDEKSAGALSSESRGILGELTPHLQNVTWTREELEATAQQFAQANDLKFGKIAQPLRAALAGRTVSPSVFDMMLVLGRDETLARIGDVTG